MKDEKTGDLIQKYWTVLTTDVGLRNILASRTCTHDHYHQRLEGGTRVAQSANYPKAMVVAVAKYIMKSETVSQVFGEGIRERDEPQVLRRLRRKTNVGEAAASTEDHLGESDDVEMRDGELRMPASDESEPKENAPLNVLERESLQNCSPEEKEIATAIVARLHSEMGHCNMRQVTEALKKKGAQTLVVAVAKTYKCSACTEAARMPLRPVVSGKIYTPGETIGIDHFYWRHPLTGALARSTIMVDYASRFSVVKVHAETSKDVNPRTTGTSSAEALGVIQDWTRHYGRFRNLRSDPDGSFREHNLRLWLASKGIRWDPDPGEAHWRNGIVERMIDTVKQAANRAARQLPIDTPAQQILDGITEAHGELHRHRGYSPSQLFLGRAPEDWGIGDHRDGNLGRVSAEINSNPLQELLERKRISFQSYIEEELSIQARRKELHRTRSVRQWETGESCWYWRTAVRKGRHHRQKEGVFMGPAKVLMQERERKPDGTEVRRPIVWLVDGMDLVRCSTVHLRPLSGAERVLEGLNGQDIQGFEQLVKELRKGTYADLSQQPGPLEEDFEEHEPFQSTTQQPVEPEEPEDADVYNDLFAPNTPVVGEQPDENLDPPEEVPAADQVPADGSQIPVSTTDGDEDLDATTASRPSPTTGTGNQQSSSSSSSATRTVRFDPEVDPGSSSSASQPPPDLARAAREILRSLDTQTGATPTTTTTQRHGKRDASPSTTETHQSKRPNLAGTHYTTLLDRAAPALLPPPGLHPGERVRPFSYELDGPEPPGFSYLQPSMTTRVEKAPTNAVWTTPDDESLEERVVEVSIPLDELDLSKWEKSPETAFMVQAKRGRAEVAVSKLTSEKKKELMAAKDTELNAWLKNHVVEAASRAGVNPKALMKMRWVVTLKDDGRVKARLVVLGFTDPRLGQIDTASPTCSRRARQVFLTLTASMGWHLRKGDVKQAFLQGNEETNEILCEPVPELARKLQLEHHQCVRLLKAVYGLTNAPRAWWTRVRKDMAALGWTECSTEPCLWTYRSKRPDRLGQLIGAAVAHVDDFMVGVSDDDEEAQQAYQQLLKLYEWGEWEDQSFVQCGVRVTQHWDRIARKWGNISLDLQDYASAIQVIDIPTARRRNPQSALTPSEVTQLRAALGALMWLGTQAAPMVLAPLSLLLGHQTSATVDTLLQANKLIRQAVIWSSTPIVLHKHEAPVVVTYSDASWACRRDGSSQTGYLVTIADGAILKGATSHLSFISWHSGKAKRVARSSSACEVQAASEAEEESEYVRLVLAEVLFGSFPLRQWPLQCRLIPAVLVLDCRGVYDALAKSESSCLGMRDKRSAIEALALKRSMASTESGLRWCHSAAQLADCLTKGAEKAREPMQLLIQRKYRWKLVYDENFTSAKNREKLGLHVLDPARQDSENVWDYIPVPPEMLEDETELEKDFLPRSEPRNLDIENSMIDLT